MAVDYFGIRITDSNGASFGPPSPVQGNWTRLLLPQYEIDHAGRNITHVPYRVVVDVPGRSKEVTVTLDRDLDVSIELGAAPDQTVLLAAVLLTVLSVLAIVVAFFLYKRRSTSARKSR